MGGCGTQKATREQKDEIKRAKKTMKKSKSAKKIKHSI